MKAATFDEAIRYCSLMAKVLRNYSYPTVSLEVENMYLPYRVWQFTLDGYEICVHMSELIVNDSVIQNIQIFPVKLYSLPFHVYFKIAVAFLGREGIVNFSIIRQGHLVSCWTKMREKSKTGSVTIRKDVSQDSYLGINYGYL